MKTPVQELWNNLLTKLMNIESTYSRGRFVFQISRFCNAMKLNAVPTVFQFSPFVHRLPPRKTATLTLVCQKRRTPLTVPHCSPNDKDLKRRLSEDDTISPGMMMTASSAFYGAMTLAAIALGNISGIKVLDSVVSPVDITGTVIWLTPMILSLLITVTYTDQIPQLKRIRRILETSFLPYLSKLPPWGPLVLAVGAGVGEEAFFRGWLQPLTISTLSTLPGNTPTLFGVFFTSVFFGLCHYVTETYFIWATIFGTLFGIESIQFGLPAAMLTHALYDWCAFIFIQETWKTTKTKILTNDRSICGGREYIEHIHHLDIRNSGLENGCGIWTVPSPSIEIPTPTPPPSLVPPPVELPSPSVSPSPVLSPPILSPSPPVSTTKPPLLPIKPKIPIIPIIPVIPIFKDDDDDEEGGGEKDENPTPRFDLPNDNDVNQVAPQTPPEAPIPISTASPSTISPKLSPSSVPSPSPTSTPIPSPTPAPVTSPSPSAENRTTKVTPFIQPAPVEETKEPVPTKIRKLDSKVVTPVAAGVVFILGLSTLAYYFLPAASAAVAAPR
eukprot:g8191.t1